jgi:ribonuclease HII
MIICFSGNKMLKSYYQSKAIEAGCDEAGRGCLAGPVFSAAVILPRDYHHKVLTDSKLLSVKDRNTLRKDIESNALAYAVTAVDHIKIDEINILQASILGMHLSLDKLKRKFGFIIIDGNYFKPYHTIPHQTIVKGDSLYFSIAAASILAKTYRDDYMTQVHAEYPHYDWINNKGYATSSHRAAIMQHGQCPLHRRSFILKEMQLDLDLVS